MENKISSLFLLVIVALAFAMGVFYYPQLPVNISSHWGASGEVNGYMTKFWGIFLIPLIMLAMLVLYFLIPLIDPLKNNIHDFRKYYNGFWILFELFFLYIFSLTIIYNLGYFFNFTAAMLPALAILFFCIGSFLKKIKRNYFVGIRTPWTLANDKVWDKTHKLGGILFQIVGALTLLGLFTRGDSIIFLIVIPAIGTAIITFIYSYIEFKKLK